MTDHGGFAPGPRGAAFACQPENDHPAHVVYKPYGLWAAQGEWTYEMPKGQRILGVAAGGPAPTKSLRVNGDVDLQVDIYKRYIEGELIACVGQWLRGGREQRW